MADGPRGASEVVAVPVTATVAVVLAVALDVLVGEPPNRFHPVAWFGRLVAPVDREWDRPRLVGVLAALLLPLLAAGTVFGSVWLAARVDPWAGAVVAGVALAATTSLRMLVTAALRVVDLSTADVAAARESLLALAGRDASELSPGLLRSAAVESAAENLADGFVAPLAAFAVVVPLASLVAPDPISLALAAGAAAWVKAVNTLDSMLGYRSKPVGGPSARLDDVVMWLPARISALLLAQVAGRPRAVLRARRWLREVPSPNSGWPMGTVAAALEVRLEKPGVYVLNAGASLPSTRTARRGVLQVASSGVVATVLAGVVAWL
ncbi:adenosylcobinamide-phosphate synthase CbiB [Haloarchaeobius baliensis]|uniref:adenosylcobinamide-phosphate synthase CbiB n=1 Tax=Haloarchaeobius baliensis TaxID=1670458 RepID=UPI003F880364